MALDASGQHTAAQASYRTVLASAPGNVAAQNNLALSLILAGHAQNGEAMLRRLRQTSDPADVATVDSNLATAPGAQAGRDNGSASQRLTASDIVFPKLPGQGAATAGGGAGTAGDTGAAAPAP